MNTDCFRLRHCFVTIVYSINVLCSLYNLSNTIAVSFVASSLQRFKSLIREPLSRCKTQIRIPFSDLFPVMFLFISSYWGNEHHLTLINQYLNETLSYFNVNVLC